MPPIGLDIGTSAVRAVQLGQGRRGAPILERIGQVTLPAGAMREGEVADPDVVADALRVLWQTFGFKGREVALGVANTRVIVRQIDLPYLPEAQLRESLSFQAQQYVPIPLDEAVYDLCPLEEHQGPDGASLSRVLLVAARKDMVTQLVEVARQAQLRPVSVDLNAFAVLRALASPDALADAGAELLIDIGASLTNVVVHSAGVPRFVRVLPVGAGAITDSLVAAHGAHPVEAELAYAAGVSVGAHMTTGAAMGAADHGSVLVAERTSRFVDEVRGSLDYYRAQPDAQRLERVLVSGGGSQLPGLSEQLMLTLGQDVDLGRPLSTVRIGKVGIDRAELERAEPFLCVGLGLALGALL